MTIEFVAITTQEPGKITQEGPYDSSKKTKKMHSVASFKSMHWMHYAMTCCIKAHPESSLIRSSFIVTFFRINFV